MNTQVKHTPGPWEHKGNRVYRKDSYEVAWIAGQGPHSEWQANATLIAAAPAMYGDLCTVRDYLLELYDEGNARAGEYAASLGITIEEAEGQHHE